MSYSEKKMAGEWSILARECPKHTIETPRKKNLMLVLYVIQMTMKTIIC